MRECDLQFCRADVPSHGQSTTNIPSRLTMTHTARPTAPTHYCCICLTLSVSAWVSLLGAQTSSLPAQVAGMRSSIARTQLGSWIRSKGQVSNSEQGELSPQETKEVEQAVDFLKELEADYQRFVADVQKRRQAKAEVAEIDKSQKTG